MSSTRKYQISNISSCTPVEVSALSRHQIYALIGPTGLSFFNSRCSLRGNCSSVHSAYKSFTCAADIPLPRRPISTLFNIGSIRKSYPVEHAARCVKLIITLCREGLIQTVVGCFNQKLAPAFMLGMVAKASVQLIGYEGWSTPKLLDLWLLDDLAATHSDLICFSRNEAPVMWLFSPFQTRPLGKELPSVITTCTCTLTEITNSSRPAHERVRRIWKVTHDGKDGKPLRDIKVKVRCSACKQFWYLQTKYLQGKLHRMGGLYAAVVPCFSS